MAAEDKGTFETPADLTREGVRSLSGCPRVSDGCAPVMIDTLDERPEAVRPGRAASVADRRPKNGSPAAKAIGAVGGDCPQLSQHIRFKVCTDATRSAYLKAQAAWQFVHRRHAPPGFGRKSPMRTSRSRCCEVSKHVAPRTRELGTRFPRVRSTKRSGESQFMNSALSGSPPNQTSRIT